MADNEIFCTVKLDEDDWRAIERAIMSIEKRIERIEAILDARGLDWDHPRVEEEPAKEPPKKWRILDPGEVVQEGDWVNAKSNLPSDPPNGWGWKPAIAAGLTVLKCDGCVFARPVADEPAKEAEPEHPAGPMPDPGEGYRILIKDPPEELQEGDELESAVGTWEASDNARTHKRQAPLLWYRRKIEPPKDEYREPVLPADAGKLCEFSDDGRTWQTETLMGFSSDGEKAPWESGTCLWEHARIKKDA